VHPAAKADLATAFVERCVEFCTPGGSTALVAPLNWHFLGSYKSLRERLLRQVTWNLVVKLGPGAFETISGEVVNDALNIQCNCSPEDEAIMAGMDVAELKRPSEKAAMLSGNAGVALSMMPQSDQLKNPDARISFRLAAHHHRLQHYAVCKL